MPHSLIENWRCIESGFEDGDLNMAIDEMLLQTGIQNSVSYPVLRFYGFRPNHATFGVGQRFVHSKTLQQLKREQKTLIRRPTGGGIVVHDLDLCYTVVLNVFSHTSFAQAEGSYEAIHQAVYAGFRRLGIGLEFSEEGVMTDRDEALCTEDVVKCDLLYQGRKLAGAAERRKEGYLLHQGFVSLKPFVHTRMEYFSFFEKARQAIQEGFQDRFGVQLTTGGLFLEEANEVVRLKKEKYGTEEWNFKGSSELIST